MPNTEKIGESDHFGALAKRRDYRSWRTLWEENAGLKGKGRRPTMLFHGIKKQDDATQYEHEPDEYQWTPEDQRTESAGTNTHTSFTTVDDRLYVRLRVVDENFELFKNAKYELVGPGLKIDPDKPLEPDPAGVLKVEIEDPSVAGHAVLTVRFPPEKPASKDAAASDSQGSATASAPAAPASSGTVNAAPATATGSAAPAAGAAPVDGSRASGAATAAEPEMIEVRFHLELGRLDPIKETGAAPPNGKFMAGVQQRLNNLGFGAGHVDGHAGPVTQSAIRSFQMLNRIAESDPDGKPQAGPKTIKALEELHDQPGRPERQKEEATTATESPAESAASQGDGGGATDAGDTAPTPDPVVEVDAGVDAPQRVIDVVKSVLKDANLSKARITDASRSMNDQAKQMFDRIKGQGRRQALAMARLYERPDAARRVIEVGWMNRNQVEDQAIRLMQEQISTVGVKNISPHCDVRIHAINIDPASLDDPAAFVAAAKAREEVTKGLEPTGSEHPDVHLEISRS